MNRLYTALAALLLASPASLAAQDRMSIPRTVVQDDVERQFANLDRDGDGLITLTEWLAADYNSDDGDGKAVFARIDANRDAGISKPELTVWQYALFDCVDANRDGTIQAGEGQDRAVRCLIEVGGFTKPPLPPKPELETKQHR